ncbi:hypothetical protein SAY86_025053 [Trapa natans]|uniref:RING-type domain-containing protein n=1 Tax=Trapa natans TaxID=22666 RepID=A0AAN7MWA4_TRANT|nr:hypothetical protein SAY86_025053 [Trapa natans]
MPSSSDLFYTRRYRVSRTEASASAVGRIWVGFDHPGDRNSHLSHNHRRDLDASDPLRRSPHLRRHHRLSHSEHPLLPLDQGNRQSAPINGTNVEPQRSTRRPAYSSTERLPGSVLLARERLLERLRGVSLSGNRLADASDRGSIISIQYPSAGSQLSNPSLPSMRAISSSGKKPPGLSQEALDQLHVKIFSHTEKSREDSVERKSQDCSICLESFMEGDKLICLPCNHAFHSDCLDPWVQTCGNCPYCRKCITVPADRSYT